MKTLEDMLKEKASGTRKAQELFAEQFNKVSNMLYKDYGICSVHMAFIVRDILDRVYSGQKVVNIDYKKMIHYNGQELVPEPGSTCYIIPMGCHKERLAEYSLHDDVFIDGRGREHYRPSVVGWRYPDKEEMDKFKEKMEEIDQ